MPYCPVVDWLRHIMRTAKIHWDHLQHYPRRQVQNLQTHDGFCETFASYHTWRLICMPYRYALHTGTRNASPFWTCTYLGYGSWGCVHTTAVVEISSHVYRPYHHWSHHCFATVAPDATPDWHHLSLSPSDITISCAVFESRSFLDSSFCFTCGSRNAAMNVVQVVIEISAVATMTAQFLQFYFIVHDGLARCLFLIRKSMRSVILLRGISYGGENTCSTSLNICLYQTHMTCGVHCMGIPPHLDTIHNIMWQV